MMLVGSLVSGQEVPQEKVDDIKTEFSRLTPEKKQIVTDKLEPETIKALKDKYGFSADVSNDLFKYAPEKEAFKHNAAPKLYLGKYGDIKAAIASEPNSNGKGGYVYAVEIPDKRYIENGNVFSYIAKNNKNLDNTTIQFTHKGSPMAPKTITYK